MNPVVRWFRLVLTLPVRAYRYFLSPLLPPACRFTPTCSQYAIEAIEVWGLRGVGMAVYRLGRCHPYSTGGYDPVPCRHDHPHHEPHG